MGKTLINISIVLAGLLCIMLLSCSKPNSGGAIKGYVLMPKGIDRENMPPEAKLFIYLRDYSPKQGKEVAPWEAPIKKVLDFKIDSLKDQKVSFKFGALPKGVYHVSVLIDTGRPHVSPGSLNFTAYPGDYTGGTKENIELKDGQIKEISITEGSYLTIPKGYKAPLYFTE